MYIEFKKKKSLKNYSATMCEITESNIGILVYYNSFKEFNIYKF